MDAFIQKFCEKYSLPIALSLQLLDNMEKFTFHKGDFLVQEGGRNSNFYIVSKGIWRGHYLNDGVDVSVWFASEGEAIFSSWGYVENTVSLVSIEAMCDSELYGISKAKLLEENPELLQYVPLKHIASYLWITPQSLSRIRAELGRRKKDQ